VRQDAWYKDLREAQYNVMLMNVNRDPCDKDALLYEICSTLYQRVQSAMESTTVLYLECTLQFRHLELS
jgi:hypothetical protein